MADRKPTLPLMVKGLIPSLLLLTMSLPVLALESPLAVTLWSKGEVSLFCQDSVNAVPLIPGAALYEGDRIVTGAEGSAQIMYVVDKAIIRLTPMTNVEFVSAGEDQGESLRRLFLEIGRLMVDFTKPLLPLEVATPTSVAAVKGTQFWVVVDKDGTTRVSTMEGMVGLLNNISGRAINLSSGATGISLPTGEISIRYSTWEEEEDKIRMSSFGTSVGALNANGMIYRYLPPSGWGYEIGGAYLFFEDNNYLKISLKTLYGLGRTRLTWFYLFAGYSYKHVHGNITSFDIIESIVSGIEQHNTTRHAIGAGMGMGIRHLKMERLWISFELPLTYWKDRLLPTPGVTLHYLVW